SPHSSLPRAIPPCRAERLDLALRARGGALEEQLALACVSRERRSTLELVMGLFEAAELCEEITPHAWQQGVCLEGRLRGQRIDELEPRCRTVSHRDRHRTVQLHHW